MLMSYGLSNDWATPARQVSGNSHRLGQGCLAACRRAAPVTKPGLAVAGRAVQREAPGCA